MILLDATKWGKRGMEVTTGSDLGSGTEGDLPVLPHHTWVGTVKSDQKPSTLGSSGPTPAGSISDQVAKRIDLASIHHQVN